MPRGSKICGSCQASNGPRAFNCKACGAAFSFKTDQESKSTATILNKNPGSPEIKTPARLTQDLQTISQFTTEIKKPEHKEFLIKGLKTDKQISRYVWIPTKDCPVKFERDWLLLNDEEQRIDKVVEWSENIRQIGFEDEIYYRNMALKYWIGTFFSPRTMEWVYARQLINDYVVDVLGDDDE